MTEERLRYTTGLPMEVLSAETLPLALCAYMEKYIEALPIPLMRNKAKMIALHIDLSEDAKAEVRAICKMAFLRDKTKIQNGMGPRIDGKAPKSDLEIWEEGEGDDSE